jgi:hypothetical protein
MRSHKCHNGLCYRCTGVVATGGHLRIVLERCDHRCHHPWDTQQITDRMAEIGSRIVSDCYRDFDEVWTSCWASEAKERLLLTHT